jgi:hypothetical protein
MTAKDMFSKLGYVVIQDNTQEEVTKHNTYIRYQNSDTETRITFERYKGVDVNVFAYGSLSPSNLTIIHGDIIKAIAQQIKEIEKENK